ncbi:hypothetical protein BOX15_Mlig007804g2, partial [Macrostomum lignano]
PLRKLFRQLFRPDSNQPVAGDSNEFIGQVRSLGHRSLSAPSLDHRHRQHLFNGDGGGLQPDQQQPPMDAATGDCGLLCSLLLPASLAGGNTSCGSPCQAAANSSAAPASLGSSRRVEFLYRARCDDAQAVLRFLSRGGGPVDLVQGGSRRTALCYAAANGNSRLAEELLALGAAVDGLGYEVPLIHACERGHLDTVRLLLASGASPACRDARGSTPLIKAVSQGHLEVVRLLLDTAAESAGASVDAVSTEPCFICLEEQSDGSSFAPDCGGLSALMRATHALRVDVARLLLDSGGASVDLANSRGNTALHSLALTCRLPAAPVSHLVHHPPLHWAATGRLLLSRACRVNPRNRCGETPLDRLVACAPATLELAPFKAQAVTAWCEVVRLLLVYGADLSNKVTFNHRETALDRLVRKLLALMECSASSQEFLALARLLLTLSRLSTRRRRLASAAAYLASHQLAASEPRLGRFFLRLRDDLSGPLSLKAASALRLRLACGDPLVARARRLPLPRTLIHYVVFGVAESAAS